MKKLCFDIGGTAIKYGIIEDYVLSDFHVISDYSYDKDYFTKKIMEVYHHYHEDVSEICISKNGYGYSERYDDMGDIIAEKLGIRVTMENDVTGATNAEYRNGALKGVNDGICVVIGSGLGIGFVIDKRIIDKENKNRIDQKIMDEYQEISEFLIRNCSSRALTGYRGKDGLYFFKHLDEKASVLLDTYCSNLVYGIKELMKLHEFEKICLCGGITNSGVFYEKMKEKADFNLVESEYRGYAPMYGAYVKSLEE